MKRLKLKRLTLLLALVLAGCAGYDPFAFANTPPTDTPQAAANMPPTPTTTPTPSLSPTPHCIVTASEALNLRAGAGTSHPVIGWLYPGDVLVIRVSSDGWSYVTTPTGAAGWVNSNYCAKGK